MFEIVAKFNRQSDDFDFFYVAHKKHPVVLGIYERFVGTVGHKELKVIRDDNQCMEISMTFDDADTFWQFAKDNIKLIEQRQQLIDQWCAKTGHVYSWYTNTEVNR
jgi:hypothetical protein